MAWVSIEEVRLINLRRICEKHGMQHVCERVPVSQPQLIQYVGPRPIRNIGKYFARKVEQRLGLEEHWLDHPHPDQPDRLHKILVYVQSLQPDKFDEFARKVERGILHIEAVLEQEAVEKGSTKKHNAGRALGDQQGSMNGKSASVDQ